jgi:hypothetical protein
MAIMWWDTIQHYTTLQYNTQVHAWCGYEVPGMILVHDLKGAMGLVCSKEMSMHVSTCISYDINT